MSAMFLVQAALGVGQAVMGHAAASQQAAMVNQQNHRRAEQLRIATIQDYDALNAMNDELVEGAVQQTNEAQLDGMRARGTAEAASGEAGVSGLSVDALMRDIFGQEQRFNESVNINLERQRTQLGREGQAIHKQGQNVVNSMPRPQKPSLLATGLRAGTSVVGAYQDNFKVKRPGG